MTRQSAIYGVSGIGTWPVLKGYSLGAAAFAGQLLVMRMEGFVGDGDYMDLPVFATGEIEYFNAAGSSQWTVARTEIHANVDDWVGITFDSDLVYAVGVDEGTTPNTFYLASINVSGTVVQIGGSQPATDFATPATNWWRSGPITDGSSLIQRELVGSGNILIHQRHVDGMWDMEMDITDGSTVRNPAVMASGFDPLGYKTKSGVYIWCKNTQIKLYAPTSGALPRNLQAVTGELVGVPQYGDFKFILWKDRVYGWKASSSASATSTRIWLADDMSDWAEALYVGMEGMTI